MNEFRPDSRRPLCFFASLMMSEIALRTEIRRIADAGFVGICVSFEATATRETWRALDETCAEYALEWHLLVSPPSQSPALVSVVRDVAAGGAAGVWESLKNERNWVLVRAVLLEGRGATWNQSLDLLRDPQELATWNGRARIFAFAREMQNGFWPCAQTAKSIAATIQTVAAMLQNPQAWRGIVVQSAEADAQAAPAFPFYDGLTDALGENAQTLISLVADTGVQAVTRRLAFWNAASQSAAKHFWQPLRDLCDERALGFTVAVAPENLSAFAVRWGKNLFRFADSVAVISREKTQNFAPTIRVLASRAALDGTLSPSLFVLHGTAENLVSEAIITGAARFAEPLPLGSSLRATLAKNEFLARAGEFSAIKSAARVALILPRSSFLAHYNPRAHRYVRWVEDDFQRTANFLETLHFDYLMLDDDELESAEVKKSTGEFDRTLLKCGAAQHSFEMLVLPSMTTLSQSAWAKIEAFVAAGGKVVCLGILPRWSENGRDIELETRIGRATMLVVADLYDAWAEAEKGEAKKSAADKSAAEMENEDEPISGVGYPVARSNDAGGRLSCYQPHLNDDAEDARLRVRGLLRDSLAPDLESQSALLRCARRTNSEGEWWLLALRGEHAARASLRIQPETAGAPFYASLQNGERQSVREWMTLSEIEGGGLVVPLEMASGEIRAFGWRAGETQWHIERSNFCLETIDETQISGYALQSGAPFVAWQEGQKLISRQGENVTIPAPIFLQNAEGDGVMRVEIPETWRDCRVFFEMANASAPVEIQINESVAGVLVAPPWKLDISAHLKSSAMEIRVVGAPEIVARLTAYPRIEIARHSSTVEFDRTLSKHD